MRIQKFLAAQGVASRRSVERLVEQGRVQVNGQTARIGHEIDPENDKIFVDGKPIQTQPSLAPVWLMLNKPIGYVTTVSDPQGRSTVMDLLPAGLPRVYPVGRLDRDTEGLLLLTNDGELTHRLLHPSQGVWKTYVAQVDPLPSESTLRLLRKGIQLDDGPTAPCQARIEDGAVVLELKEGRKRQVRRMLAAVGFPVLQLRRVAFGPLKLGRLEIGQTRRLREQEIAALQRASSPT